MIRMPISARPHWQTLAREYGFKFHTMHGETYWDESAYYQFTLRQIEDDLEAPSAELHQMCLAVVDEVVKDAYWLERFCIPESFWDAIHDSWQNREPSLYSRLDLAYNGQGPAKLYENNADTPTSLYETGFWQWLWLEDQVNAGLLPTAADQYNSLQEALINRFAHLHTQHPEQTLYLACCRDSEEDRGTVQYLQDCAEQSGIACEFIYIEELGHGEGGWLTDLQDRTIPWLFKLYPWEFMLREDFAPLIVSAQVNWLEPLWKAVISNKALLPLLWQRFPQHPNLLPAFFEDEIDNLQSGSWVKKPLFSREGANISVIRDGQIVKASDGPYGEEGFIYQAYAPLPSFGDNHTLIGSWLIDDLPAGISIREDANAITQDLSRYLPHIILD